tara:strand:+ start:616 stop:1281 length:666 start_codon:yes stop_codon:yes gene_type:complete
MKNALPIVQPAVMADEWVLLMASITRVDFASHIQIDVMDGILVPSTSFPYNETNLEGRKLPEGVDFEAHLMVVNPEAMGIAFIQAGCRRITAQLEGFGTGIVDVIQRWRIAGAEAVGISIMLDTPLTHIDELIPHIDSLQIMSIASIGYQGHAFDERALIRIRELSKRYPDVIIAVDGGVNESNIHLVTAAGADVIGVGSALMRTDNPKETYTHLCSLMNT